MRQKYDEGGGERNVINGYQLIPQSSKIEELFVETTTSRRHVDDIEGQIGRPTICDPPRNKGSSSSNKLMQDGGEEGHLLDRPTRIQQGGFEVGARRKKERKKERTADCIQHAWATFIVNWTSARECAIPARVWS